MVESVKPDNELIRDLRSLASRPTTVRQLVDLIRERLALSDAALLTILWYFTNAFCLPLPKVLPIREWLGSDQDEEIDALILPEINQAKSRWMEKNSETVEMTQ